MEVAEDELLIVVWEGNLKKKTPRGLVKVWQSRYFRLLGDVLEYYKSDKLGVCSGMIPLQMMTGLVVHPRAKKEGCRFDLIIEVGQTRKVFALLAPSASICEKLVRSMRNMLHHPVDESARMDIENIDLRGAFWKRIDEIDRRRAGSSKKVDVAAQFAGFDIKPRQRRKKPTMDSVAEGATDPATTSGSPPTTSRMERERMQVDAQVEEVETPAIRILKELDPLPVGQLFLARDNATKIPYYMHVMNRVPEDDAPAVVVAGMTAATRAAEKAKAAAAQQQLNEVQQLWAEMMKLNHPLLIRHVATGESFDRTWMLYTRPHDASLQFHVAALIKQQQDALARQILAAPHLPPPPALPVPSMLLEEHLLVHLSSQLLLMLEHLHRHHILAVHLDLAHLYLTAHGHLMLVDFFLMEHKEGSTKGRREATDVHFQTPEFLRGEQEDAKADTWRYGLVMYQLLTGRLPAGLHRPMQQPNRRVPPPEEDPPEDGESTPSTPEEDPLTADQRAKANILSFDSTNEEHLSFPRHTSPALESLIRSCLHSSPSQRLGGQEAATSNPPNAMPTLAAAASPHTKQATLTSHAFHADIDWVERRKEIKSAQFGLAPLPPAPDFVFDSLLYASHSFAFQSSTLHAHVTSEYKIHVLVKSGRHFARAPDSTPGLVSSVSSRSLTSLTNHSPVNHGSVATKFYIKVLVDGKALKTDVCDSAPTPNRWSWNKSMHFTANDASLESDLIARVMVLDEESFHDATIGAVAIPLRYVYQMCVGQERADQLSELDRSDDHPARSSAAGVPPDEKGLRSWFSVVDRDGFVVGELLLVFRVETATATPAAVAPVASRKRFSTLFGAPFSSDADKETSGAVPTDVTQREIDLAQMVPAEKAPGEEKEPSGEDAISVHLIAQPKHAGPLVARRTSSIIVAAAPNSTVHINARGSMLGLTQPVVEEDEDDEDDEEEKALSPTSSHTLGVSLIPDRKPSPQPGRKLVGAGSTGSAPPSPALSNVGPAASTAAAAAPQAGGAVGFLRGLVSKKKMRYQEDGFDLDLSYVGPRLIAMGFPSEGTEATYRNPMPQVQLFFQRYHPHAYKVYNLCSERKYDHAKFEQCCGGRVAEYPFDDHNACPVSMILDFCVDVHAWLTANPKHVAAIHCKAGKGRTGLMISAYLLYCGACAHPEAALAYFATHRTSNGKGVTIPSQLRYVHYFHHYLTRYYDWNRPFPFAGIPLLLTHVRITGLPKIDLVSGGCDPWFTLFQADRCVFDFQQAKLAPGGAQSRSGGNGGIVSGHGANAGGGEAASSDSLAASSDHLDFKVFIWVRGDCKLLLYDKDRLGRSQKIAWFWFHTSFVSSQSPSANGGVHLTLTKREIDGAIKDKESKTFPPHFQMEMWLEREATNTGPAGETGRDDSYRPAQQVARHESLVTAATEAARAAYDKRLTSQMGAQQGEVKEEEENEETPRPLVLPFDVPAAARADALVHAQAVRSFAEWHADAIEAATLFQPEAPPS